MIQQPITTRFAPSPTGRLHLGHAASALFAYEKAAGGRFLLRIEDIDPVRCKDEYCAGIFEDLHWLGLEWPEPVRRQSAHLADYTAALDRLREAGLFYPCFCTRKEVEAEAAAAASAPHTLPEGAEGPLYPRTCRTLSGQEQTERAQSRACVWRLDMVEAVRRAGPLRWHDAACGWQDAHPERFGDVVLARKDVATSYHLSVTLDDALQGISCVTRGMDLFAVTAIHVLLQKLLDLPVPAYHHHPLLTGPDGKRYAKRDRALTLQALRLSGVTAKDIKERVRF